MKNTMSKAVWGVFFILLGISLAGRAVGVFDFNIFFPGWWTLFIIVPSAIGLVNSENRKACIFGLGIGILLLLTAQGIVGWYTFPRLIIALIFISIGFSFLFRRERREGEEDYYSGNRESNRDKDAQGSDGTWNSYNNQDGGGDKNGYNGQNSDRENPTGSYHKDNSGYRSDYNNNNYRTRHNGYHHFTACLSGRNIQFVDEEFTGADVMSILGNIQLDLRNAILNDDVVIETTCILGGVDIYVPNNAKVVLNCTPILGGAENKVISLYNTEGNIYTIFIRGICILGGIEVR